MCGHDRHQDNQGVWSGVEKDDRFGNSSCKKEHVEDEAKLEKLISLLL